jgi:serine/threonine protein kinase
MGGANMEGNESILPIGFRINTYNGKAVEVLKYLGGGGQGDVYEVKYGDERKALKWYKNLGNNPTAFYNNIKNNVEKGSPEQGYDKDIFLWPLDLTEWDGNTFGYIMDLRPQGYYDLTKFLIPGTIKFASWKVTVDACLEIVTAFRYLHKRGYSYQDLNDGNFFINPKNGGVRIADNDNVAPAGINTGVLGKPRFMAPEIVRKDNMPNADSDKYSLALILFMILCGGHPLEGEVGTPFVLTTKVSEQIYGTNPVFVYDLDNAVNRPIPGTHDNVILLWRLMPTYMKELFLKAFSKQSLLEHKNRVTELEWMKALVRFRSDIMVCSCGNEVFTENAQATKCDKCGKVISAANKIKLKDYALPAVMGTRIYALQVMTTNQDKALDPIAVVVGKKENPSILGIRNLSGGTWDCTTSTGGSRTLQHTETAPIKAGIKFRTVDYEFELI